MGIISWILFGLIAGAIAKALHRGKDPGGWIVTIIIGILGSMLGGWIGSSVLGWGDVNGWNFKSFALAIVGAVILLWLYSLLRRKPASDA
ncbi:MAG TPA: GlsB/YeaQ/YmgE family stress response membrane protein [Arachidicoccus sp.]|nr:GlsB/YeaQ/YmgE family stress response membrane protein [Arachidicoccus sp.]